MKLLQLLLPYAESVPLPQTARQVFGLSQPLLTGSFTLEQLASASSLHQYLSMLQLRIHDEELRLYQFTYKLHGPMDNVSDTERNSPSIEFRSMGPYSQLKPLTDKNEFERLAAKMKEVTKPYLVGAKIYDMHGVGQDWTQLTTFFEPIGFRDLIAMIVRLPGVSTHNQNLRLAYVKVPTSFYWAALDGKLPLEKPQK
ncbi:hypothetical protein HYV80_01205 [Candidatus Woesearchaeota archaeon]|nr:hypothetical protein [Candidatus Woesearchaeota archaeon]